MSWADFRACCAPVPGLQGRARTDPQPSENPAPRARFDAVNATLRPGPDDAVETILDRIGVGRRGLSRQG
ncbi:MAG: hypothetical protein HLUCCA08_05265 [Rhodobacteraceae bacterium HLUCCA08]|nr:MAG: hypothetical protein HLUCCA08_05265 [Rhodobacteraceae bacterium HLUCCA08]